MKRFTTLIGMLVLCIASLFAQAPEKFTYQAVVRNANNTLVTNAQVGVRVNILQGTATGNAVYSETHVVSSNANGLVTINIGDGSVLHGSFANIDWADGPYFLKTDIDPNGGNDYSIISTQQLLSVPYALYAKEAANSFSGDYNDLSNKPQIPTVPTNVSAFTNDAGYITNNDIPAIPTVPTNVSAFTNDAGYIIGYTETDPQFNAWDKDYNDLINRPTIPTVPDSVSAFVNDAGYLTSYTEQQMLSISNDTIFLTGGGFVKLPAAAVGFSGDYNDLSNKPQIPTVPTNVSAFSNDAGYLTSFTEQQILSISNDTIFLTGGSFVKLPAGFDGDYNSLTNKPVIPTVPTSLSAFVNDMGYITAIPDSLGGISIESDPIFSAWDKDYNDLINTPEIPTVPTNVSSFSNDAGYVTANQLSNANYITAEDIPAQVNADWNATEGAAQILNKPSLFSGNYNDLTNKPQFPMVPTNVSAFSNDAGYITMDSIPDMPTVPTNLSAFVNDVGYITAIPDSLGGISIESDPIFSAWDKDYNDLINTPEIPIVPTNVGAFTNDAGYVTASQLSSANYITAEDIPAQVNADWNATEGAAQILNKPTLFSGDYNDLTNKPTIPIVNNATLTIQRNGASVGTFTADASINETINIIVPTSTSELTNNSGFLTSYTETDPTIYSWAKAAVKPTYSYSEILNTPTLFDGNYNSLTNRPTIPAPANDAILTIQKNGSPIGTFTANSSTNQTINVTVPTTTSELTNNSGFITSANVADMTNMINTLNNRIDSLNNVIASMGGGTPVVTPGHPTVVTGEVTNITTSTATCAAEIPNSGGLAVTDRGVCWSLNPNPTLAGQYVAASNAGTGSFTVNISGLSIGSTYYVRAYATNSLGTTYGNQVIFYTPTYPTVTTADVVAGGSNTAAGGGNVTATGGAEVTARGVCWSIYPNPTLNDAHTTDGTGIGSFSSVLTGLSSNVTYYVRAYATNLAGTSYGEQKTVFAILSEMPVVETVNVTNVEISTVTFNGNVLFDGGYPITARGFCYATTQNPTISDAITTNGSGNGYFSCNLTGLAANTTYYVRAYATNLAGTSYGAQMTFTTKNMGLPCSDMPTVVDVDGNTYHTVIINDQCWMKENLRTTKKPDGSALNSGRYSPGGNANNVAVYGYLYTWSAMMNGASSSGANPSGVQGICPTGWHVPSNTEWTQMINYIQSQGVFYCNNSSSNIAKVLADTTGWNSNTTTCAVGNNQSSNNATGFGALPAGFYYSSQSSCYHFGADANFWSATQNGSNIASAYYRTLNYNKAVVESGTNSKTDGYSVRCLRD